MKEAFYIYSILYLLNDKQALMPDYLCIYNIAFYSHLIKDRKHSIVIALSEVMVINSKNAVFKK